VGLKAYLNGKFVDGFICSGAILVSIFSPHISFEQLVSLAEKRILAEEQAPLMAHLAQCEQCASEFAKLERLLSVMRADTSRDAPQALIAQAIRLFRSSASSSKTWLQRIQAVLQFESTGLTPVFGARSGASHSRRFLYRAHHYELDLRVNPHGEAWIVSGQILGGDEGAAQTGLTSAWVKLQNATIAAQTSVSDQSEFTLPPVPADTYQLIVHLPDLEVEVSPLAIG